MSNDTVYKIVTEQIVKHLEQGTVPWRQPWNAGDHAPRSINGRRYTGVNVFLLHLARLTAGYSSPYWLTYKRAGQLGGHVRKGEASTLVIFWKRIQVTETDPETGQQITKTVPMLRYYRVFNLDQCDGIEAPTPTDVADNDHVENRTAEEVIGHYLVNGGPTLSEDGTEAFYTTAFHELGHSTNHASRLDRHYPNDNGFGSHGYGREELVAEMTSAFLGAECGITETVPIHAAYCRSWVRVLKDDVRAVVVAAGAAQKAADMILGRTVEHEQGHRELAAVA